MILFEIFGSLQVSLIILRNFVNEKQALILYEEEIFHSQAIQNILCFV